MSIFKSFSHFVIFFFFWGYWEGCVLTSLIYMWLSKFPNITVETDFFPTVYSFLRKFCCCIAVYNVVLVSGVQQSESVICYCSVAKSCPPLCDYMDCNTPGFPVIHHLLEFAQIHVHLFSDAIQPFHPLSPPSPPAFNLSQHQGFFQWVSSLHQIAKVLECQLENQSFQWIFRTDFL